MVLCAFYVYRANGHCEGCNNVMETESNTSLPLLPTKLAKGEKYRVSQLTLSAKVLSLRVQLLSY